MAIPLIGAAGAAAIRILPAAVTALRSGTAAMGHMLSNPMTTGRYLATTAVTGAAAVTVPMAIKVAEHESGGAITQSAYEGTVNYLKDKIREGVDVREIEDAMDKLDYIIAVNGAFKKGAQNIYVTEIMQQNAGDDAIKKGKMAAVSFQLLPDSLMMLSAKQAVRTAIADDMFKGDRNQADKYLARSLVADIVGNAQVDALKGNQVGSEDVKAALSEIINNPDRHPMASRFFADRGRLMNGLRQLCPEVFQAQAQMQMQSLAIRQREDEKKRKEEEEKAALSQKFNDVMQKNGFTLFSSISTFLAVTLDLFGLGGLADHFKRAVIAESTVSQYGDRFGLMDRPDPGNHDRPHPQLRPVPLARLEV